MINSNPMKNLAVQMVHGALDNIQKGNKYAEQSRLFLSEYGDTWCAIVLDIPVDVISRGIDGVLSGSNTLGSLSGYQPSGAYLFSSVVIGTSAPIISSFS